MQELLETVRKMKTHPLADFPYEYREGYNDAITDVLGEIYSLLVQEEK